MFGVLLAVLAIDAVILGEDLPRERELIPYFRAHYGPGEPLGPARVWWVRPGPRPGRG